MFHRVVPPSEISPYGMAAFEITPQALEMLINFFLKRGYRIISLDEVCDSLARDAANDKFIVLTFDDGYKDTLTYAYPILRKYQAPFTVNITWNYAERTAIKWDYLAEDVISRHNTVEVGKFDGAVKLDCSTIPPALFESHVFGHTRGAYTDAVREGDGILESAENGTVFIYRT